MGVNAFKKTDTGNVNRLKYYANFGIFANIVAVIFLAVVAFDITGNSEEETVLPLIAITATALLFSMYVMWSHFYSEAWKLRRELKILQLQKEVDNLETSIANQSGGNRD